MSDRKASKIILNVLLQITIKNTTIFFYKDFHVSNQDKNTNI